MALHRRESPFWSTDPAARMIGTPNKSDIQLYRIMSFVMAITLAVIPGTAAPRSSRLPRTRASVCAAVKNMAAMHGWFQNALS